MTMTRLETIYREKVVPVLQKDFAYKSPMQLPGIEKISLNIGLGSASQKNDKLLEEAVAELTAIAGQKAVTTHARKSIAAFKLREGVAIGARVTLRRDGMWDFLDKLMNFALPRVRDFRGVPDRGFDGRGNFTLGVKEHMIFPEMESDRVENPKGMNITIVTTAKTDREGKLLLEQLGMPFRK
jgi:large subunit ribosomal protein L5